jgi:eukaryotic-like serine/threonine-protein kinase
MVINRAEVQAALPHYELLDVIGRGGYGVVFRARHRGLDQVRAVKAVATPGLDQDVTSQRFRIEAQVMSGLDHPHIVRVAEYAEHGTLRLLVMEYLPGGTLADRLTSAIRPEVACAWTLAVADALQAAHERGVIHRDVKPDNLLFTEDGRLKVSDFGIAKPLTGTAATTSPGLLGTLLYMAPEQLVEAPVTPATDVYALGATLYQLLAGRTAYPDSVGPPRLLNLRLSEEPAPLVGVPSRLAAVVGHAMRREPAERPATAREFGLELAAAAAAELGPGWPRASGVPLRIAPELLDAAAVAEPITIDEPIPVVESIPVVELAPVAPTGVARWRRAVPVGALAAIVLVAVGVMALRPDDDPERSSATNSSDATIATAAASNTPAAGTTTPWAVQDPWPPYWLPASSQAPDNPLGGIRVTSPAEGARVPATCITVRGTSTLPAGKTLLLALRNTSGATNAPYFYHRIHGDEPPSLATWSGSGNINHSVYQIWQIAVLLADADQLDEIWNKYAPSRSAMDSAQVLIPGLRLAALRSFKVVGGSVRC